MPHPRRRVATHCPRRRVATHRPWRVPIAHRTRGRGTARHPRCWAWPHVGCQRRCGAGSRQRGIGGNVVWCGGGRQPLAFAELCRCQRRGCPGDRFASFDRLYDKGGGWQNRTSCSLARSLVPLLYPHYEARPRRTREEGRRRRVHILVSAVALLVFPRVRVPVGVGSVGRRLTRRPVIAPVRPTMCRGPPPNPHVATLRAAEYKEETHSH